MSADVNNEEATAPVDREAGDYASAFCYFKPRASSNVEAVKHYRPGIWGNLRKATVNMNTFMVSPVDIRATIVSNNNSKVA